MPKKYLLNHANHQESIDALSRRYIKNNQKQLDSLNLHSDNPILQKPNGAKIAVGDLLFTRNTRLGAAKLGVELNKQHADGRLALLRNSDLSIINMLATPFGESDTQEKPTVRFERGRLYRWRNSDKAWLNRIAGLLSAEKYISYFSHWRHYYRDLGNLPRLELASLMNSDDIASNTVVTAFQNQQASYKERGRMVRWLMRMRLYLQNPLDAAGLLFNGDVSAKRKQITTALLLTKNNEEQARLDLIKAVVEDDEAALKHAIFTGVYTSTYDNGDEAPLTTIDSIDLAQAYTEWFALHGGRSHYPAPDLLTGSLAPIKSHKEQYKHVPGLYSNKDVAERHGAIMQAYSVREKVLAYAFEKQRRTKLREVCWASAQKFKGLDQQTIDIFHINAYHLAQNQKDIQATTDRIEVLNGLITTISETLKNPPIKLERLFLAIKKELNKDKILNDRLTGKISQLQNKYINAAQQDGCYNLQQLLDAALDDEYRHIADTVNEFNHYLDDSIEKSADSPKPQKPRWLIDHFNQVEEINSRYHRAEETCLAKNAANRALSSVWINAQQKNVTLMSRGLFSRVRRASYKVLDLIGALAALPLITVGVMKVLLVLPFLVPALVPILAPLAPVLLPAAAALMTAFVPLVAISLTCLLTPVVARTIEVLYNKVVHKQNPTKEERNQILMGPAVLLLGLVSGGIGPIAKAAYSLVFSIGLKTLKSIKAIGGAIATGVNFVVGTPISYVSRFFRRKKPAEIIDENTKNTILNSSSLAVDMSGNAENDHKVDDSVNEDIHLRFEHIRNSVPKGMLGNVVHNEVDESDNEELVSSEDDNDVVQSLNNDRNKNKEKKDEDLSLSDAHVLSCNHAQYP